MRSLLLLVVAVLSACALQPVGTAERESLVTSSSGATLRPAAAPQGRRERPKNYLDVMIGASYWDDLGSLDPTGVGPVPGRFGRFDDWGFAFDMGYDRVIESKLGVMDANAIVLCRDQRMPIRVFNVFDEGNLVRIIKGEAIGTLVS